MAIAQVQKASVQPGAATSSTATYGATPTDGDKLVAFFRAQTALANITLPAGWSNAVSIEGSSALVSLVIAYKDASGDGTGVVFTTSASVQQDLAIAEYSGLLAGGPDKTASAASAGTATSQSTGTTAATTQADELVLAAMGLNGSAGGFANTWTNSFLQQAALVRSTWAHRIVTATGTFETTEGWTTTQRAAAAIATFKAASAFPDRSAPRGVLRGVRPN